MSPTIVLRDDCKLNIIIQNITIGIKPSIQASSAVLILLLFGVFSLGLSFLFSWIRKKVYRDKDNLDRAFDAGGQVSVGLTSTTIVSEWTWAATLLQSSTVATKYGISGPFWYAAGATIQILLFAMISIELKIRAPGAKTFLQVIQARFGRAAHLTYCFYALLTNVIVTAMLMLGGCAVLTSLVQNLSVELAAGLICAVMGTYTFLGGRGATFYVCYFNTMLIFIIMLIFMIQVYHTPGLDFNKLGSVDRVFEVLSCTPGPSGNYGNSFLTMISRDGLLFGIINIIGNFGTVFIDQSYWQSSVAAKPRDGVWGFLSAGLVWFAIPFCFASTMGLAYLALGSLQGHSLLSGNEVDSGLVPPVVAQRLMGSSGEFLMIIMLIMAITSTGSAEIMAVVSILVYDIYAVYLRPYRRTFDANTCILCGKMRGRMATARDKCECESMTFCRNCEEDDRAREATKRAIKPPFKCRIHGSFRIYNEYLGHLKNWGIVCVAILIVPLTLVLNMLNVNLGWLYSFMGVLIGSAVVPVCLCMVWNHLTGLSMIVGAVSGTVIALIAWIVHAIIQGNGLTASNFIDATGQVEVMLTGNLISILWSLFITVIMSLISKILKPNPDPESTWENTRDIDNPLSPWTEIYATDLRLSGAHRLDNRPSLADVGKAFRISRWVAIIGSCSLTFLMIIAWPLIMLAVKQMDSSNFSSWILLSNVWAFLGAAFIIITPVVNEITKLRATVIQNKVMDSFALNNLQ